MNKTIMLLTLTLVLFLIGMAALVGTAIVPAMTPVQNYLVWIFLTSMPAMILVGVLTNASIRY